MLHLHIKIQKLPTLVHCCYSFGVNIQDYYSHANLSYNSPLIYIYIYRERERERERELIKNNKVTV